MSSSHVCLARILAPLLLIALLTPAAAAQWVNFVNETATRLVADNDLGAGDIDEKDYAWGDVDKDGDIDLVVVRKEEFTSIGKRENVLFLNEGGVLVDRSALASFSDVAGDRGFRTHTNDRDVILVDVDGDTWLDIVTAPTISDGDPLHIGHPRVYINKQVDPETDKWRGFAHERNRIPDMLSWSGASGHNPRFCSVTAGDLTGDGFPELYFGDYDNGEIGPSMPPGADFNDRLLLNDGSGTFSDATQERLPGVMSIPGSDNDPFEISRFGAADVIADMNGDGTLDVVKQTSLQSPFFVAIAYNDPANEGFFSDYEVVIQDSPYFINVGDLNNDDLLDIVVTDDGADRFLVNQGNGGDGLANFVTQGFQYQGASDDGFGGNSIIADLDNDGWNDVLISDVDVDTFGCDRRMHVFHNQGGLPGANPVLLEETEGTNCQGASASCNIASIPANMLQGVHDVAIFDIDGDGWKDMVIGRCSGTEVWMNSPPSGIAINLLDTLPTFVNPGETFDLQLQIAPYGGAVIQAGSEQLFTSIDGGLFTPSSLTPLGGDLYQATLPAAPCAATVRFYFRAQATGGEPFTDPADAPATTYSAVAAFGTTVRFEDRVEGDVAGWTIDSHASLTTGAWEQADPNFTLSGSELAAPDEDADDGDGNVMAFVTENGAPGGAAGASDVDGGPTDLITPPVDLAGSDAIISYHRWMFSTGADVLEVSVSNDGSSWVPVEIVDGSNNSWQRAEFQVSRFVVPTATTQVRFRTSDVLPASIVEAAVDFFTVGELICETCTGREDCIDGLFCNGVEQCTDDACVPGTAPCPGQQCDELNDQCVECLDGSDCDNGDFCDGAETCVDNACVAASDPCGGGMCDEVIDQCVDCLDSDDCDNAVFCDGVETCAGGVCAGGVDPCPGQTCDEENLECVGSVTLQPKPGKPLLGLTASELARFDAGRTAFDTVLSPGEGLGPVFNDNSCASCHNTPVGGSGSVTVTRFGFVDEKEGGFDPLEGLGGSLLQSEAINAMCAESVPPEANVTASRLTNSTLGFGLVEAIADTLIVANETTPPPGVSGKAHDVEMLEEPGTPRIGRFGWKSQVATVLTFSGDAGLNEMGLTNRLVGTENAPNGDLPLLALCDTVDDPEDGPDGEGFDFIDRVTDFQRFLAPPPQTPRSGMTGETVFNTVGCVRCHVASFTTASDAASVPLPAGTVLEDAIKNKTAKVYSDFLLHDMGAAADFIEQGEGTGFELRTPPLWGARLRDPMWHDGRVLGGTFESRIRLVIDEHDAVGSEAQASAQAFLAATPGDQDALIAFVDSLGRCEFDMNGDGVVDGTDYAEFQSCFTGPGNFYTPDDPCSVADPDQDGDVDDDDLDLFRVAVEAECLEDFDCDNGDYCDGAEICVANSCVPGTDPCPGEQCDEVIDQCVECLADSHCDNGVFCDGVETCSGGDCLDGTDPCPGQTCDELVDSCIGSVTLQPKPGKPLLGLTASELARFDAGRTAFDTVLSPGEGLGPVFNDNSCASCHNTPVGGSGSVTVTRFGFVDEKEGGFDPLEGLGGSLLQSEAISTMCAESVPPEANVTASRLTNSTLGFGLVEAIADTLIVANETTPPPGVSGKAHDVEMLEEPGTPRIGRFGWKSQVATVLTFSGDAGLNEMGLTNRLVGTENAPNGDLPLLALCDTVDDPEDGPDGEGFDFIDRVTDFQRFLAPPPQTPRSGMTGETVFNTVGCASCHIASFTTVNDPASVPLPAGTVLEDAIRNKTAKVYSDFLLHDMGAAADFIEQGEGTGFELRTPPLWGARLRDPMWHDGRVLGGTFESRIRLVIDEHDAVGSEARASAQAFLAATPGDQDALIAFVDSLGRCEFDMNGDGVVDGADHAEFQSCFTGPGNFYTPDDPCSVGDPDQDGDVDDDDFDLFLVAVDGVAGEVPNGGDVPGVPLTVDPAGGGDLALSWSASCLGADNDYAIYEGTLGDYSSHTSVTCSTMGTTAATVTPSGGNTYYLVVPLNGFREGGYGTHSSGAQRPQGSAACLPQAIGTCN